MRLIRRPRLDCGAQSNPWPPRRLHPEAQKGNAMNVVHRIDPTGNGADSGVRARLLADDASAFFGHSHDRMQTIPRDELASLQLAALQYRFEALRDRIPMLQKLADRQNIARLEAIEDVVPLLFEHTMYKSYPPTLLEKNRFTDITRWMGKLTSVDLSGIDVSGCDSIDSWLEIMDRDSPLAVIHSSGTSGTMSFLPCSKREWEKFGQTQMIQLTQTFGAGADPNEPLGE